MSICNDPALTYLRGIGYNVVRFPREDIVPLDMLLKGTPAEHVGPIGQIWKHDGKVPKPAIINTAAVHSDATQSFKATLGVKILQGLLSNLGIGKLGAKASMSKNSSIRFHFTNPTVLGLTPVALGSILATGQITDKKNPAVVRYLKAAGKEVYLVGEVLRSNRVDIEFIGATKQDAEIDAVAVEQVLNAGLKAASAKRVAAQITVKTAQPLTFGFKAYRIRYTDGKWKWLDAVKAGDAFLAAEKSPPPAAFFPGSGMLELAQ